MEVVGSGHHDGSVAAIMATDDGHSTDSGGQWLSDNHRGGTPMTTVVGKLAFFVKTF